MMSRTTVAQVLTRTILAVVAVVVGYTTLNDPGAHWVDPTSPEYSGATFGRTFLYGFYDGEMAFVEPMIAKAFLQSAPNVTVPLKLPQAYQKSGYLPTSYSVRSDASSREVRVALTGMQLR